MKFHFVSCFIGMILSGTVCVADELNDAIQNAKNSCSGISDSMNDMKRLAGINTAITSVGTVSGGVALGTGIAKSKLDEVRKSFNERIAQLVALNPGAKTEPFIIEDRENFFKELDSLVENNSSDEVGYVAEQSKKMEQKSVMLGNIRTGTLAVSGVSNVAGAAIAANNKIDDGFKEKIQKCISAVNNLNYFQTRARVEKTSDEATIEMAGRIISACRDWGTVDLNKVNNRATGTVISSGIGAGTGALGTIISAVANTKKTRSGDKTTEKGLNTTANVMAGATTAASATATAFNVAQIVAIKQIVKVADKCEGAL